MAGVRFADVQSRPAEFLNLTSLTLEEFQVLVAPFEAAFQEHMAAWRLDGKPRTARRFTVYRTCPLATPDERLFFVLTYLGSRQELCVAVRRLYKPKTAAFEIIVIPPSLWRRI